MPTNRLGNFIRERRQDLNLTQEELAERISGTATQAEISRLERGLIMLPRRTRLDALAVALDVSLGSLLMHSGWLTCDEQALVDGLSEGSVVPDPVSKAAVLAEVGDLHTALLAILERVELLQATLQGFAGASRRPEVNVPAGVFDEWEASALFNA